MQKIVLASANKNKVIQIQKMLGELPIQLLSLIDFPEIIDIEETGDTFVENALIKARVAFQYSGLPSISDDSGLEVDALDGAPGVYSARYAGSPTNDSANNEKLLQALEGVPIRLRSAQYRCVAALVTTGVEKTTEGVIRGEILRAPQGSGGFGYDPLFVPNGYNITFAELGEVAKYRISHRGQAFAKLGKIIRELLLK